MILKGTQIIQNVGDMARFGAILFQILAPLQLALVMFLSAIQAASNIAIEKDRQTLILLLMSRLTNSELVLGKLFASLLSIGVMLITSLPIFMLIVLFGGTSFEQVGWTFAVTLMTCVAAGSLGAIVALWREKTFQTLALVAMGIVFWLGLCEGIGLAGPVVAGFTGAEIAGAMVEANPEMAGDIATGVAMSAPAAMEDVASTLIEANPEATATMAAVLAETVLLDLNHNHDTKQFSNRPLNPSNMNVD